MIDNPKPTPPINPWTAPFWKAAREHRLLIQHCHKCGRNVFYPRLYCPFCLSDDLGWVESSGRGKVYTFSVVLNNAPTAFLTDMPFVIAIVKLEEGVQMMTNIVGCSPVDVHCEMPVAVAFEELNAEITVPKFTPVRS